MVLLNPEVQVRLESGPGAAVHSPLAEQNGFLQCRLQAFSADFLMTSLRNLALFLGDDSASQVLPMEIAIKDTHVNLKVHLDIFIFHNTIIMAKRMNDISIIAISIEINIMVSVKFNFHFVYLVFSLFWSVKRTQKCRSCFFFCRVLDMLYVFKSG